MHRQSRPARIEFSDATVSLTVLLRAPFRGRQIRKIAEPLVQLGDSETRYLPRPDRPVSQGRAAALAQPIANRRRGVEGSTGG